MWSIRVIFYILMLYKLEKNDCEMGIKKLLILEFLKLNL